MNYEFDVYSISAIITLAQLLILIMSLLISRSFNKVKLLLILFFSALVFDLFHHIIIDTKIILSVPFFGGSRSIAQYVYGPTIYLIIIFLIAPSKKWKPFHLLHFIPFMINLIVFIMQANGTNLTQITNNKDTDITPFWTN